MTIGSSLLFTVSIHTNPGNIYGYSVLVAIGSGLTCSTGYSIAGIKASLKGGLAVDVQSATSMQNIWQVGLGTMGSLIISGQIFQSYAFRNLKSVLASLDLSDAEIHNAVSGTQSATFQSLSPALTAKAIEAITKAISKTYILGMVIGVLAVFASLAMKWERLFGMTSHIGGG